MDQKKGANSTYFGNISEAVKTSLHGLKLSMDHLKDSLKNQRRDDTTASDDKYFNHENSIVTLKYPEEVLPVPDNGRYKLDLEIDDCIVCDKCAKICPVDCIEIDPILSTDVIGETSDGTPRRIYAAKFDIDMAKCMFCGLCTYVCPTECLTMTKSYDFSELDMRSLTYGFANMSEEEVTEKKELFNKEQERKKAAKMEAAKKVVEEPKAEPTTAKKAAKPKFKPRVIKK
ncbi:MULTISPECIES: 4Fe-4S dicluster domain-containing protein [Flammeovirga]|uniref:4Fe-4S dicluster domain-containing protein n=1 Tax=Flammeovirga agarivorans TaxID=2726742 RepID=A0A7X8XWP3_9BACT|nr:MULTISPECIES: 4Fe-4S dicluster domain-containing protein [Flammeovirga]NLR92419.1 4Fe-4S dicluster domain-containing protein [Flammeovirga agarivorans]